MLESKRFLLFLGFIFFIFNTNSNSLENKILVKIENQIITSIDVNNEYKNDCLVAALKFNKSFYKDNDLKPTEDLFFSITLIPLTTYEREIYKKTPGQSGLKGWFR